MSENTDTETIGAGDANAAALAAIAGKLGELGLAPEGETFDIAEVTTAALQLLTDRAARLDEELAAANDSVAKLEKAAADALAVPKASPAARAPKSRKVSVRDVQLKRDGDDDERAEKLLEAIRGAEVVEIAFSDGAKEIAALDPVQISGEAWRKTMVGIQLTIPELLINGPAVGKAGYPINGYGLFLDGVLAAFSARGEQLTIAGGSKQNVAPDIVF